MIFEVAYKNKILVVLKSSDSEKQLSSTSLNPKMVFEVIGEINGAEIRFESRLQKETEEELILTFPGSIQYLQRRMSHREQISYSRQVSMSLPGKTQELRATVRDICAEGARLHISKPEIINIEKEDVFDNCLLKLDENTEIPCNIEVRHVNQGQEEVLSFGTRFVELDKANKQTLEKFIVRLEHSRLQNLRIR